MTATSPDLLRKLADNDEVDIETRGNATSPLHRTTIWIVPTDKGVYVRSVYVKGRWYQEALANRNVTIRAGRRKVAARVQRVNDASVIRAVNAAAREKYGERWPKDASRSCGSRGSAPPYDSSHCSPHPDPPPPAGEGDSKR